MNFNDITLNVLIKGKPITEYPHNGQVFVEGRSGSEFEIEIRNNLSYRVEAVVAVDGLSVTDGKEAGPQSSGYLLEARETIRIPGWKLDAAQVAAFEFAGKGQSYATQATGTSRNNGVIGIMAFREKRVTPLSGGWGALRGLQISAQPWIGGTGAIGGQPGGSWSASSIATNSLSPGVSINAVDLSAFDPDERGGVYMAAAATPTMNSLSIQSSAATASLTGAAPRTRATKKAAAAIETPQVQNLGTGFGERQDFATSTVSFERGDLHAMLVLYYDDARGLRSRGIDLSRRARKRETQQPVAFPGMGCTPPAGWRG